MLGVTFLLLLASVHRSMLHDGECQFLHICAHINLAISYRPYHMKYQYVNISQYHNHHNGITTHKLEKILHSSRLYVML